MNKLSYFLIAIFLLVNNTNKLFSMDKNHFENIENILKEEKESLIKDILKNINETKNVIQETKLIIKFQKLRNKNKEDNFKKMENFIKDIETKLNSIEENLNKNSETINLSNIKEIITEAIRDLNTIGDFIKPDNF
jgi:hypothetical protein